MLNSASSADVVMGQDVLTINVGSGVTMALSGVWSMVSGGNVAQEGGLMPEVDALFDVNSSTAITKDLVGKTATGKGEGFRIMNVDVGEVFTQFQLVNEAQIL